MLFSRLPAHPELNGPIARHYHERGREIPPRQSLHPNTRVKVSKLGIVLDGDAPIIQFDKHGVSPARQNPVPARKSTRPQPCISARPSLNPSHGNPRPVSNGAAHPPSPASPRTAEPVRTTGHSQKTSIRPVIENGIAASQAPNETVFQAAVHLVARRRGHKETLAKVVLSKEKPPKMGMFKLYIMEKLFAEKAIDLWHTYDTQSECTVLTVRFSDEPGQQRGKAEDNVSVYTMKFGCKDDAIEFLQVAQALWAGQDIPVIHVHELEDVATQPVQPSEPNNTRIVTPAAVRTGSRAPQDKGLAGHASHWQAGLATAADFDPFNVSFSSSRPASRASSQAPAARNNPAPPGPGPGPGASATPRPPPGLTAPPGRTSSSTAPPAPSLTAPSSSATSTTLRPPPGLPVPSGPATSATILPPPGLTAPPDPAASTTLRPPPDFPLPVGVSAPKGARPPPGSPIPHEITPQPSDQSKRAQPSAQSAPRSAPPQTRSPEPTMRPPPGFGTPAATPKAVPTKNSDVESTKTEAAEDQVMKTEPVRSELRDAPSGSVVVTETERQKLLRTLETITEMSTRASADGTVDMESVELIGRILAALQSGQLIDPVPDAVPTLGNNERNQSSTRSQNGPEDTTRVQASSEGGCMLVEQRVSGTTPKTAISHEQELGSTAVNLKHPTQSARRETGRIRRNVEDMMALRQSAVRPPHWLSELRFLPLRGELAPTPTRRPVPKSQLTLEEQINKILISAHDTEEPTRVTIPTNGNINPEGPEPAVRVQRETTDTEDSQEGGWRQPEMAADHKPEPVLPPNTRTINAGLGASLWAGEDSMVHNPNSFTGGVRVEWPAHSYLNDLMQLMPDSAVASESATLRSNPPTELRDAVAPFRGSAVQPPQTPRWRSPDAALREPASKAPVRGLGASRWCK